MLYDTFDTPLGELLAVSDGHALTHLHMEPFRVGPSWQRSPLRDVRTQLAEYFARERRKFELALTPRGTEFELRVWEALRQIPYGETASYGEIARRIGAPGAARAVGIANARNPIAVIVPCHRVIGSNGTLTGYAGGLERKRLLLDLEAGVLSMLFGGVHARPRAAAHAPQRDRAHAPGPTP